MLTFDRSCVARYRTRVIGALGMMVVTVAVLSGCAVFFPSRPQSPLAMKVQNRELIFEWCGRANTFEGLEITYSSYDSDALNVDLAIGFGRFRLQPGSQFSSKNPPDGITYTVQNAVADDVETGDIFVYSYAGQGRVEASFVFDSFTALEGAGWWHPDGTVTPDACPRG